MNTMIKEEEGFYFGEYEDHTPIIKFKTSYKLLTYFMTRTISRTQNINCTEFIPQCVA